MNEPEPTPPAWLTRLLVRVVGGREGPSVAGELAEAYRARVANDGPRAARRWYRRQAWGFLWRAALVRRASSGEGRRVMTIEALWADVRWAIRGLRTRPGFTAVVVLTLALGIGANSAIFTLVNAHFFESLPYHQPDRLALVWETSRNSQEVTTVAPGNYFQWTERATEFEELAAYNVDFATLSGEAAAEQVNSSLVTPNFFRVLGVTPALGAGFSDDLVRGEGGDLVILSHSLWTRRYGADPALVGTSIRIDGRPHTVVGVLPPDFRQPERSLTWQVTELWRPMTLESRRDDHGSRYLRTIGRLAETSSVETARAQMLSLAAALADEHPEPNAGRSVLVFTLDDYLLAEGRPTLIMLLLAGAAVLLIVCANVANLTLARGEERRREFALRAALGAGGGRMARQVLVEGVVLALLGAAVGSVLVFGGSDALQSLQTRFFSGLIDVAVDARVIVVTALGGVAAGVLVGLPLARTASTPDLRATLVSGGARAGGRSDGRLRGALVVGQVGLATTLLVVASLLSRSFAELVAVPPGFESAGVATVTLSPSSATYPEAADVARYHAEVFAAIEAIPGVETIGAASDLMFTTENVFTTLTLPGRVVDPSAPPRSEYRIVAASYFDALSIPILAGELPQVDDEVGEIPIVVNQRFAELFWPGEDAVGATAALEWTDPQVVRVAAVVGNVLDDGYAASAEPIFYLPFEIVRRRRMSYLVRASADAGALLQPLQAAVEAVDPDVPAGELRLLSTMLAESVARPRAASMIGAVFALLALLVSAAGIYGVISYSVQKRTRELGIRAALGADGGQMMSMVMGESSRLLIMGLLLGSVGAILAGGRLAGLLFGVRPWDPGSFFAALAVLGAVGSLAAWIPARRAVRVDPREALRAE